ncbi:hypothetical protein KR222_003391, partial [Zaprionus bogoriensis]
SGKRVFLALMVGILLGFCFAQLISYITISENIKTSKNIHNREIYSKYNLMNAALPDLQNVHHEHPGDNSSVAEQLKKDVRILCWVMTNPTNHKKKARHVKRTWGKRCNVLLFMSSEADDELPTVKLDVGEGRPNLWRKVKEAFKYVYKYHFNDADWFYKADDDTYAVIENLRYMLYPYSPQTPVHFGYKFKPFVKQGYMSGGSGYVLSKEAVRRLVVEGIPNPKICLPGTVINEDIEIGRCMENLNVTAGDSRDAIGRGRMFPFVPESHLIPNKDPKSWYWSYQYYKSDDGLDCCSDNAISFHYVSPGMMYVLDYLIYHLKPYGLLRSSESLPRKLQVGELMPAPRIETLDSSEDSKDDEDDRYSTSTTSASVTTAEPDSREVEDNEKVSFIKSKQQKIQNQQSLKLMKEIRKLDKKTKKLENLLKKDVES